MGPADWLERQLFDRRTVLLTGPLDSAAATRVAAALVALDAGAVEPIELHVGSPDGALDAAFHVIDTMDALRSPVRATCRGRIGGSVVGVVAGADDRSAAPHTQFHLAQPITRFTGTPESIAQQNRHHQDLLWRLYARLAQRTARAAEELAEDMRRGRYLDAAQALAYGLIDRILAPRT